jgi:hypothetical protein
MSGVGSKVLMDGERQRYKVTARDERFVIMTKPFNAQRTYLYSIADRKRGVRGPCNLIFGPPSKLDTEDGAAQALAMLQTGEMDVSYRRDKPLTEGEIERLYTSTGAAGPARSA